MTQILEAMEDWEISASNEAIVKYFFPVKGLKAIENGKKVFIVGRKGTGKTAIAEYIIDKAKNTFDAFATLISMENFPFELLYKLEDRSYPRELRYITVWKYCIYLSLFSLMRVDETTRYVVEDFLAEILPKKKASLLKTIKFGVSAIDAGGHFELSRDLLDEEIDIPSAVRAMEDRLSGGGLTSTYYIIIDQLDDSFREMVDPSTREKYVSLITGLLKASAYLNNHSRKNGNNIFPIVCIRNDIYDLVEDADKSKWIPIKEDMSWGVDDLKMMIRNRIIKSTPTSHRRTNFSNVWRQVCYSSPIEISRTKKKQLFEYMVGSTFMRPRDIVQYIKLSAEHALKNGNKKITRNAVIVAEKEFSEFLKVDLESEIYPLVPDIRMIFDAISAHERRVFSFEDFTRMYSEFASSEQKELAKVINRGYKSYLDPGSHEKNKIYYITNVLFWYSVFGNVTGRRKVFRYNHPSFNFLVRQDIAVHRGLRHALKMRL